MDLVKRMLATQKTVDTFKGRAFRDGRSDCVQLILAHSRHMGRPIKVPKYRDVKGAAGVLKKLGFKTLAEAMDHHFTRIDVSRVLAGDIVEMPGANGFSGLTVSVGNGRVLGFHEDIEHCEILQPLLISGVWRIEAKAKRRGR
jgi:hypothetical protein